MASEVDTLEVSISESDRRETSGQWCIDIVDIYALNGMEVALSGLVRLFSVRESAYNGVDHPSYLLGGFLFVWRLLIASWLIVSLSSTIFCSVSSSIRPVIPMMLLLVSSGSYSYLVVVWPLNKLG